MSFVCGGNEFLRGWCNCPETAPIVRARMRQAEDVSPSIMSNKWILEPISGYDDGNIGSATRQRSCERSPQLERGRASDPLCSRGGSPGRLFAPPNEEQPICHDKRLASGPWGRLRAFNLSRQLDPRQ